MIGGVDIPYAKGLKGHSDADVLIHAICDALIGAAALGDIGMHFPDTDPRFRDVDSRKLLRDVAALLAREGWRAINIDSSVIAEAPRLAPYIPAMRENIAADLGLAIGDVNVKARTSEKLGYIGRGEGIVVHAIACIKCLRSGDRTTS
ncbi:MAG: 2-C-methyl-D-erythritol 2,4-cyclodiphosphate synthase [Pseudomonadota bacterium]|nr:2-C-methyl-D-erythritol 2,4-cyclodiphosphate synthase [Pseudomonadota bacterium]